MKKFTQLSEQKMSKTEGGILVTTIIGLTLAFGSAFGFGAAVSASLERNNK